MAFTPFIKRKVCPDVVDPTFIPLIERIRCIPLEHAGVSHLSAISVVAGNPLISSASIGQKHSLNTTNIETQNVVIGSPEVGGKLISITMDMTTPSTAGINLTFASGSINMDWKEGGGLVPFVSGVELQHPYITPGTYIAEITGDLENITKFIADNSKITQITDLKTGLLTDFRISNNLFVGVLDMSFAPVSGRLDILSNSGLIGVTFASLGNGLLSRFVGDNCDITGTLDLTNVPVSGIFSLINNTNLTGITFAPSGNGKISSLDLLNCDITGTLDLSNVTVGGGTWRTSNNSSLTAITFASSGNTKLTAFRSVLCDLAGTLNLTNVPIGSIFHVNDNTNLTGVTFSSSGNTIVTQFIASTCNFSSLDLSNLPISTQVDLNFNSNLSSITFAGAGNGAVDIFTMAGCNLPNIDFSIFGLNTSSIISQINNLFTATEHDNQIINIDGTGAINGGLAILTGNTARTAASDTAYNNMISNGWSIT